LIHVSIGEEPPLNDWDAMIGSVPEGNIFQSAAWGRYLQTAGYEVFYLLANDSAGLPVGSLVAFIEGRRSGNRYTDGKPLTCVAKRLAACIFPVLRFIGGPLVYVRNRFEESNDAIIREIHRLGRRIKVFEVRGTAPVHGDRQLATSWSTSSSTWGTSLIDLTLPESQLWDNLHRSARKSVRKARDERVVGRQMTDGSEIGSYLQLLQKTRHDLGLEMPPAYPDEIMWKCLGTSGHLRIFFAEIGDRLCHGLGVLVFNGVLYEIGVARDVEGLVGAGAGDVVKWNIICWGAATGQRVYDLAGVAPNPADAKEEGIRRYKTKFGGTYVEYPIHAYSCSRMRSTLYRQIRTRL
jgi:lipid II:glycine glycyltransferase (peptidoglycan interpeptide bridge formation enzyme)